MADDTEGLSAFSVLSVSVVLGRRKYEHHGQGVEGDTAVAGGVGVAAPPRGGLRDEYATNDQNRE